MKKPRNKVGTVNVNLDLTESKNSIPLIGWHN